MFSFPIVRLYPETETVSHTRQAAISNTDTKELLAFSTCELQPLMSYDRNKRFNYKELKAFLIIFKLLENTICSSSEIDK